MSDRYQATSEDIEIILCALRVQLLKRLEQKGYGIFVSSHEILGSLTEEMHELTEAIRSDDLADISDELIDVAVGALFGALSVSTGKMDWPK